MAIPPLKACHDDAELVAYELIRLAIVELTQDEQIDVNTVAGMLDRLQQKYGGLGVLSTVASLARHSALHINQIAPHDNASPDEWLDMWVVHKLQQHQEENDDLSAGDQQ